MAEVMSIAGYKIDALIDRGAHGAVYRAQTADPADGPVALKVVEQAANLERLLLEPELLARFQHPNIVRLRDYFLHAGKLVLVMDYEDGPSLEQVLKDGKRFTPAEVREFLVQGARAVGHAHEKGVFHSDLKPANIVVTQRLGETRYVLIDFGVGRMVERIQLHKRVAGTWLYMAPEQVRGRAGMASDLWALGCIAFRMLTGVHPFEAATGEELVSKVLHHTPVFPDDGDAHDDDLERTIARLLAKNTLERFESAEALLVELKSGPQAAVESSAPRARSSWEARAKREVTKNWLWAAFWVGLAYLPSLFVGAFFSSAAAWLLWSGAERRSRLRVVAGVCVLMAGFCAAVFVTAVIGAIVGEERASLLSMAELGFGLFLLPAGTRLLRLRNLRRDLVLFRMIRSGRQGALDSLAQYVRAHSGDVHAQERYIEGLLATDQAADAVVEARTLLTVDPYNFDASLLLAHAYYDLGLYERCEQVCYGYLETSGQCFEFQDILARTKARLAEAA